MPDGFRRVNPGRLSCSALMYLLPAKPNETLGLWHVSDWCYTLCATWADCMGGSRSSDTVVRFGAYELDQQAGELRKDGVRIRLQEQPLQVLQILLERPGAAVGREELQRRIWPSDTFVDFDH